MKLIAKLYNADLGYTASKEIPLKFDMKHYEYYTQENTLYIFSSLIEVEPNPCVLDFFYEGNNQPINSVDFTNKSTYNQFLKALNEAIDFLYE